MNFLRRRLSRAATVYVHLLIGLFLLALALPVAFGQTGNGTVSGTVHDPAGAVVPAAKVTITHTETGVVRTTESSSVGIYYFGSLPIGPYKVSVEKGGFASWAGWPAGWAGFASAGIGRS